MKTILLLNDESSRGQLMLQNVASTKVTLHETVAIAGCNCDRWGHPCPRYDERNVQPKARLTISSPAKQTT
jgi:hypothetical protein